MGSGNDPVVWQALDAWTGDFEIRRQNSAWRVELFKPSQQWTAWGMTLIEAVQRAMTEADCG